MPWSRRTFLGGAIATACIGCTSDDDDATASGVTGTSAPPAATNPELPPSGTVVAGALADLGGAATPTYVPAAKAWLVALDPQAAAVVAVEADESLLPGLEHGLLALSEKCPHLGCRVPYCETSEWFECACHGTKFTKAGEHRDGPGPRGLDAFPVSVVDEQVVIGGGGLVRGAPTGTVLLDQPAAGPHCVDDVER